ncbi:hypothetical protein QJS10_CPB15g01532 [Acorus calamus]|uniref:DNA (cytosine-5)-methyltransferase 1 replication foci domain-containing protein n=1 Tax=Acorus calamus TaxID=4465 RepID=A0AAV9D763_ACOCL|nr:hypothetical protein QJS10_CPB15g01532 [Acorus calamus]
MKCPWDDDEEITSDSITNYYFEDGNDEPVSYSVLPLLFSDDGDEVVPQTPKGGVFLHGEAGIAKFHRQVKAWRVDILGPAPEVLVLTKDDKWIRLVKPRRSFAEEIRKILIVVRCLHYLRRKPYTSEKLLWETVGSLYDFRPSEADVVDHLPLISMMMKKDEVLAKSKGGQSDLGGKRFIVGDDEDVYESLCDVVGNDDDEESDLFDTVCAICDNGGELLCCEGICMRLFHPTIKAGGDSYCLSLGYTDAEVEAIQNFLCRNCQFKKHQCFICGKLGSSDKSIGAENCFTQEMKQQQHSIRKRLLLGNHLLVLCTNVLFASEEKIKRKHPMDEKLRTPTRNHIEFPDVPDKRKTNFQELRKNVLAKTKKAVSKEMSREETEVRTKTPKILDKLEDIINRHGIPSTHVCFAKSDDKTITLEKVEGSVEDVRTALQKLKEGCSIEDAKAVCEPEIVNQIIKWKNKFKDYLAPFLHGLRYTSFDRHFTKKEKLQEGGVYSPRFTEWCIFLFSPGDGWGADCRETPLIVDFCCGANDFSCFMKQKLDETGKKCLFKNYDIIQPKNDFDFVKKDWMTVQRNDLNKWSELIIVGLNPPFGVKAALANKFIDKALQFKPKLLILIVPEETERLDKKKRSEYDLIWEDCKSLSGKCFYLPGSFDTKDEQWNVNPPVLYLWSHKAWSQRHRIIAEQHGHASRNQKEPYPAYKDQAQETHEHPVVDPVFEETTLSKETHKHPVVDPVLEETTLSKHISQPDHNMCDRSWSTKQKKRRRERPMKAKKAKKIRVARRSDNSGQGPPSQESCHLMHKHNSSVGPLNPVRVGFTEDSHSSGFDASSMSSTPAEERFPRNMGGGAGFADRGPLFTGLHDPRMGAMHVAQCYAPPRFEMYFGRSAAAIRGDLHELPWRPCSGGYSSHPGGCVHGRFGSVGWLDE